MNHLRIVRGDPTPEEIAVLTALVTASGDGAPDEPVARRGGWADPARSFRRPLHPGPNGWRAQS